MSLLRQAHVKAPALSECLIRLHGTASLLRRTRVRVLPAGQRAGAAPSATAGIIAEFASR